MELSSIPLKLDMFEMKLWKTYSNRSLFKCIYIDYTQIKMKIICKRVLTEARQTKMIEKNNAGHLEKYVRSFLLKYYISHRKMLFKTKLEFLEFIALCN